MKTSMLVESWKKFLNEGLPTDEGQFSDPGLPEPQGAPVPEDPDLTYPTTFKGKEGEVLEVDKQKALDLIKDSQDVSFEYYYVSSEFPEGVKISIRGQDPFIVEHSGRVIPL